MDWRELVRQMKPDLDPSAFVYDEAKFARMKMEGYNRQTGDLTDYDCPKCLNRGNFQRLREDNSSYIQDCSCLSIRSTLRRMKQSGLGSALDKFTFEKFSPTQPWQQTMKDRAMAYAANPQGWFLACGQSGSGKTHLCSAIAFSLMKAGKRLYYMPWREDISVLKSQDDPRRWELLEKCKTVPVLYIDDLFKTGRSADGSVRPTQADVSLAFEILNSRCQSERLTILSTEFFPEELVRIDEATAGRILDMAGENYLSVGRDMKKNYRLRRVI